MGVNGVNGVLGVLGVSGVRGDTGVLGVSGVRGVTGLSGVKGVSGVSLVTGVSGVSGVTGVTSVSGTGEWTSPGWARVTSGMVIYPIVLHSSCITKYSYLTNTWLDLQSFQSEQCFLMWDVQLAMKKSKMGLT